MTHRPLTKSEVLAELRDVCGWSLDRIIEEFGIYASYIEWLRNQSPSVDVGDLIVLWGKSCTSAIGCIVDREMKDRGLA